MEDEIERVCCDATPPGGGTLQPNSGRVYRAVLIRPGEWLGKGMRCPAAVLEREAHKFDGLASFLNPPAPQPGQHGHPMLERLLGVTEHARWDPEQQAVVADYRLADTDVANGFRRLVDGWLRAKSEGRPVPAIGLSAVPWVRLGPPDAAGVREVREIIRVDQVDAVYRPAAGGEFLQVLNAVQPLNRAGALNLTGGDSMDQELLGHGVTHEQDGGASRARPARKRRARLSELVGAARQSVLDARLALSGLPERWRTVVRAGLAQDWTVDQLDASIGRVRAAWANDVAGRTVQGVRGLGGAQAGVTGMQTGLDQLTEAFEALAEGRPTRNGVRPLAGIREFYHLLSGDLEMTGRFREDRVYLANVNSTTMANIVANVLNKVVVNEFQQYPRWWEPIVRRESFATLQTVKWTTLGGVGELPSVAEGAAYTELEWTDASQTAAWQKRGGYLGLTLEAMDKDDTGRIRSVGPALAQSAWLTLSKAVSAIFTAASGAGPTLADGVALFEASSHGNLGTAALSSTAWGAAKLAMRKQAELGSGERLGALTSPRYLLVPPDLEATALTIFASEGVLGSANNDINPHSAGGSTFDARLDAARRHIIVVDLWTDTNNWAAAADPRLYPTIGMGFRYGETPEIFSVASPSSGLMFSNDVMPVKVRWFFAVGPQDYRGLYKANVAG